MHDENLFNTIRDLAKRYETRDFIDADPSQFMHKVKGGRNQETIAFIAQSISYGSRKQFLPKIQALLDASKGEPFDWMRNGGFREIVADDDHCFYRLYTCKAMRSFLEAFSLLINEYGSLRNFVEQHTQKGDCMSALDAICNWFSKHDSYHILPRNTNSACKRLCMFMRWMTRDNSPVDIGIWSDIIRKDTLIMPLDTHVMQQARRLGLITSNTTSMSTAKKLTQRMKEIFPDDPLLGDFALFGYGVDEENN